MPESFVNQATGRCSVEGSKYWFNCNPDGPYHWFKVNWIDRRKDKNLLYIHFTMDDNLSLSQKIKARYRSMYSGVFFKRYILGLWAMAEGIIYDMFSQDKNVVDAEAIAEEYRQKTGHEFWMGDQYVSCDYGTRTRRPFCCGVREPTRNGTAAESITIPAAIKADRKRIKSFRMI